MRLDLNGVVLYGPDELCELSTSDWCPSAGLLYCAESDLDMALVRSPAIYRRYVDRLKKLLTEDLTAGKKLWKHTSIRACVWPLSVHIQILLLQPSTPTQSDSGGTSTNIPPV